MTVWILTVWLIHANGMLEVMQKTPYGSEGACLQASAEIEMPDGVSWIASCRPGVDAPK